MDWGNWFSNKISNVDIKVFNKIIFPIFSVPRLVIKIEDLSLSLINLRAYWKKFRVKHKVATPYHPHNSEQVEVSNRETNNVLEKKISFSKIDWALKLDDTFREFKTTYKTHIKVTLFKIIYGKSCHIPVKIEHKGFWSIKALNLDVKFFRKRESYN